MIKMYTVDRIENNKVILEDRKNNVFFDVSIDLFNYKVEEGDIVELVNNLYVKNNELTNNIKENIRLRFDKLKK